MIEYNYNQEESGEIFSIICFSRYDYDNDYDNIFQIIFNLNEYANNKRKLYRKKRNLATSIYIDEELFVNDKLFMIINSFIKFLITNNFISFHIWLSHECNRYLVIDASFGSFDKTTPIYLINNKYRLSIIYNSSGLFKYPAVKVYLAYDEKYRAEEILTFYIPKEVEYQEIFDKMNLIIDKKYNFPCILEEQVKRILIS